MSKYDYDKDFDPNQYIPTLNGRSGSNNVFDTMENNITCNMVFDTIAKIHYFIEVLFISIQHITI